MLHVSTSTFHVDQVVEDGSLISFFFFSEKMRPHILCQALFSLKSNKNAEHSNEMSSFILSENNNKKPSSYVYLHGSGITFCGIFHLCLCQLQCGRF